MAEMETAQETLEIRETADTIESKRNKKAVRDRDEQVRNRPAAKNRQGEQTRRVREDSSATRELIPFRSSLPIAWGCLEGGVQTKNKHVPPCLRR